MIKTAVILCGGEGTRLRPLTYSIPKSLIPIQGKPIVEHIMDFLGSYNIENIILSTGHLREKIKEYVDQNKTSLNISIIEETTPLGTGGALKLLEPTQTRDDFIVSNGDELKSFNIEEMYKIHKENNALATVALLAVDNPSLYGVVRIENNKILEFVEKPKNPPSNLINAGFYILSPQILELIPEGFSMIEKEVFPKVAEMGRLYGYPFKGQWFDTGTPERLERARREWKGVA